jgi:enterochelin esterase-like enzyme
MKGKVILHKYESKILKTNPLKDPYLRDLIVYLPPGYSHTSSKGYSAVVGLAGFGGNGKMMLNTDPLGENIEDRMNRLISCNECGPLILVLIDCFTRFGGNQYLNSSATGRYEDYIIKEIVPFVNKSYNVSKYAVWGKSSGGYGSIVLGMKHPDVFAGLADHSGDSGFEYCYIQDFPKAADAFRDVGGPKKWLDNFWKKPNRHQQLDAAPLNVLAMAGHYSPNPKSKELGLDLPFDVTTGEIRTSIWNRWLSRDPVRMVERYSENLRKLKLIYIDCGTKDEFNLHWGARMLHTKLEKLHIAHFYEEFDDGHMNTSYRYDISLPKIYSALSDND